jgi:hypothetical protein
VVDVALSWTAVGSILVIVLGVLLLGLVAWQKRIVQSREKQARKAPRHDDVEEIEGEDGEGASAGWRKFWQDARTGWRKFWDEFVAAPDIKRPSLSRGAIATLLALGILGYACAALLPPQVALIGVLPAGGALVLWYWIEIGPPKDGSLARRAKTLRRLGCDDSTHPQYTPGQRTRSDLAVYLPALIAASHAGVYLDRPDGAVIAWALLIIPATIIMTARKHESRILSSYRTQRTWLLLHEDKIREVLESKAGFGEIDKAPASAVRRSAGNRRYRSRP